jgi:hypothetical protein
MRIPQIPMEWMDPMSWRLPSGKALAEFALQAGFLAPLMLGTPSFRKKKKKAAAADDGVIGTGGIGAGVIGTRVIGTGGNGTRVIEKMEKQPEEGPESSGTFRSKTGREAGR